MVDNELLVAAAVGAAVVIAIKRVLASTLPLGRPEPGPVIVAAVHVMLATWLYGREQNELSRIRV